MLPRPASPRVALGAGLGVGALLLAALAAPASATPHSAVGALAAVSTSPYSAFSSGDILYANAANLTAIDVTKASTGQSAAGVGAHGGALTTTDQLGQPLLKQSKSGKTSYGHSAGANVGLLTTLAAQPAIAQTLVESTAPNPSSASGKLLTLPIDPLVHADVLPGSTAANTLSSGACVTGKDLSFGAAHVANATVVSAGAAATVASLGGTSDVTSHTKLVNPTTASGAVVNTGKSGLLGETTLNLAPLTLLKGTPIAITVDVLRPIRLSAAAGGVPGTSVVSYGAVGASGTTPVVKITIGTTSTTLTSAQVFGGDGYKIALGVLDLTIGGKAHSLTGLEGTSPSLATNGTSASAAVDFIRVAVPGKLPTPGLNPLGGPLAPLNAALNPLISGLAAVTGPLQTALTNAGLSVADVRQGHLEAATTVPAGGIDCSTENPLNESMKDVSALHVAPGSTFQYDVRVPNRGTSDVTNVKVVDTYSSGLDFVSSTPAPTAHSGNTLTYDLGTIVPNAFKVITLTFKVPGSAAEGTKYRNDAVITGTYNGQPVTRTVGVDGPTVGPPRTGACNLSGSSKFASNLRVKTGENFGYFVNVLNSGGQPCLSTTVTDKLISGVSFVSCSNSCTHSGQDVTWNVGTVDPGQSKVLFVVVKVTATSGSLPNTAVVTSPSGTGGRPHTPGPVITTQTVASPGSPAEGPNGQLPRTGLETGGVALGLALLGGGAFLYRRRRTV